MTYQIIGRDSELQALAQSLDTLRRKVEQQSTTQSNGIVVYGRGGIGKTLLLRNFYLDIKRSWQKRAGNSLCVALDFQSSDVHVMQSIMNAIADGIQTYFSGNENVFTAFYSKLVALLMAQRDLRSAHDIETRKNDVKRAFFETLANLAEVYPIIILMDTVEKLEMRASTNVKAEVVAFLTELFNTSNTLFILAGRDETFAPSVPNNYIRYHWFEDVKILPVPAHFHRMQLQPLYEPGVARSLVLSLLKIAPTDVSFQDEIPVLERQLALFKQKMESYSPIFLVMFTEYFKRFGRIDPRIFERTQDEIQGALVEHYLRVARSVDTVLLWMIHGNYPFDIELIQALSGMPRAWAEARFHRLQELRFVITHPDNTVTLHDEMQRLLQKYVWEKLEPEHARRSKIRILTAILQHYLTKHRAVQAKIAHLLATARKSYINLPQFGEKTNTLEMRRELLQLQVMHAPELPVEWLEQERLELRERTLLIEMEGLANELYALEAKEFFEKQVEILERKWELFKRSYAKDYQQEIMGYMDRVIIPNAKEIGWWDNPEENPDVYFKIRRRDLQLRLEARGDYEQVQQSYEALLVRVAQSPKCNTPEFIRLRVQLEFRRIEAGLRLVTEGDKLQEYENQLDDAVRTCEAYGFKEPLSEIKIQLGSINAMQMDLAKATKCFDDALDSLGSEISEPMRTQMLLTEILHNYGYALRHNDLQSSTLLCERAYELALQERRHYLAARIQLELSELYRLKGDYAQAEAAVERAYKYALPAGRRIDDAVDTHIFNHDLPLLSLVQLGVVRWYLGEYTNDDHKRTQAEQDLGRAIDALKPRRGFQWRAELARVYYVLSRYSQELSPLRATSIFHEAETFIRAGMELAYALKNDFRIMTGLRNKLQFVVELQPTLTYADFCTVPEYQTYREMLAAWDQREQENQNDDPYETCAIFLTQIEFAAGEVAQRDPRALDVALKHHQQALRYVVPRVRYKPTLLYEIPDRLRAALDRLKDDETKMRWLKSFQQFVEQQPEVARAFPSLLDFIIASRLRIKSPIATAVRQKPVDIASKGFLAHRLILHEDYQRAASVIEDQLRPHEPEQYHLCAVEYALDEGYHDRPDEPVRVADLGDRLESVRAWALASNPLNAARWWVASARCILIDGGSDDKRRALMHFKNAIETAAELPDFYPWVCIYFGRALLRFGLYEAAKLIFNRAVETAMNLNSAVCAGIAAQELALLHSRTGNNQSALEYAEASAHLMKERGHFRGLARAYTARAMVKRGRVSYRHLLGSQTSDADLYDAALEDLQSAAVVAGSANYEGWIGEINREYAVTRSVAARDIVDFKPDVARALFDQAWTDLERASEQVKQIPIATERISARARVQQASMMLHKTAQAFEEEEIGDSAAISIALLNESHAILRQQEWMLFMTLATDWLELSYIYDLFRFEFTEDIIAPSETRYGRFQQEDPLYEMVLEVDKRLTELGQNLPAILPSFGVTGFSDSVTISALAEHHKGRLELIAGTLAQVEGGNQAALEHYVRGIRLIAHGAYATNYVKRVIDMLDVRFGQLHNPDLRMWWASMMKDNWGKSEIIRSNFPELLTFCDFQKLIGTHESGEGL